MKTTDKYVFFWNGPFSNWHPAKFVFGSREFSNTEQAFMWFKAIYFEDHATAKLILVSPDPKRAKELGREVKGYDDVKWAKARFSLMVGVNFCKFSQNAELQAELLATGNKTLVEASPYDKVWGIGMGENEPGIEDEKNWKGENLLGKALMEVRSKLADNGETVQFTLDEAIKFCFTDEVYAAMRKLISRPELLRAACLVAFKREWDSWPKTSQHFCVAKKLRKSLLELENTGTNTEIQ